jgi:hypothetical protein
VCPQAPGKIQKARKREKIQSEKMKKNTEKERHGKRKDSSDDWEICLFESQVPFPHHRYPQAQPLVFPT